MAIHFFSEQTSLPRFRKNGIKKWIEAVVAQHMRKTGNITYIFTNDIFLLNINKQYLNHDYYTDIITFDYSTEKHIHGDIYISVDRVNDNASRLGTEHNELFRVIIHGVLHLLGYNDGNDNDKTSMTNAEEKALAQLDKFNVNL
ncbi:MAG TPA: rRNA maturation RNase YbeY [Bacteroidales bacterium]|nr:rRNA maturation RNase YbeY [Bacteroidales bacterium]